MRVDQITKNKKQKMNKLNFKVSFEKVNGKRIAWPTTKAFNSSSERKSKMAQIAAAFGGYVVADSYVVIP